MAILFGRRRLLTLLAGATAAPALLASRGARAQRPMPVIGFLHPGSPEIIASRLRVFHQALKEEGFVEGENVTIAYRWAEGRNDRLPALAAELVRRKVAVIVAAPSANEVAAIAKDAAKTIPVVFGVSDDPVKLGLVASLARPGGNVTGVNFFNSEVNAKRLELLRQLIPDARRIAVLIDPNYLSGTVAAHDVEEAAPTLGLQTQVLRASSVRDIDAAFATIAQERHDALFVAGGPLFNSRRLQLTMLAARHAVPASYASRDYPDYGGLMSYGTNVADAFHQVGLYAGRVLKGAKPSDLPVVQVSRIELVINNQTARTLGLTVPPTLLATADEVIE